MKDTIQLTKAQNRELRRLSGLAYERELSVATGALQSDFERWRKGEIDVFALEESGYFGKHPPRDRIYKDEGES